MPLPDERPRQSVANLIGRFEQQTKRQSLTPATAPRSSSVVSHTTGDSAKEEAKEKREWPPKSDKTSPPSSWARRSVAPSEPASPPSDATDMTTPTAPLGEPVARSPAEPPALTPAADPAPPPQKQLSIAESGAPKPAPVAVPRLPASPTKAPASRLATPRSPVKPSVRASLGAAVQPLKPQLTGQSTSSTSTRKPPIPKSVPNTPSRSKTPRPSATTTRPKTPSTTRPKTPSGLFAPTAASLAKARNAQPQLPIPIKKPTLSSSAADRLSKPTAASLNRARTPTSAASTPVRGTAKPAIRGPLPTRGTPVTRGTPAPTATRTKKDIMAGVAVTAAGAGIGIAATLEAEDIPSEEEPVYEENGHQLDPPGLGSAGPDEVEVNRAELESSLEVQDAVVEALHESPREAHTPLPEPEVLEVEVTTPEADVLSDISLTVSEPEMHSDSNDRIDEAKPRVRDDLEDIVNLLESVSLVTARPESIASIPDEEE